MPITVDCPSCNRKLRVPDDLLGKKVKCPTCSTTFTAEEAAAPPPEPPVEEEVEERVPARRPAAPPPDEYAEDEEEEDEGYERPRRRRRRRSYSVPHRGSLVLVLGILSVVGILSIILGPIAWSMGNHDLKEIRAGRMDPEGEGTTNAGRICGIIGTIIGALQVLCCGVYVVAIIAAVASGNMH